jgi:hypothetical protein
MIHNLKALIAAALLYISPAFAQTYDQVLWGLQTSSGYPYALSFKRDGSWRTVGSLLESGQFVPSGLLTFTCGANSWLSSSSNGTPICTQPNFTDIAGTLPAGVIGAPTSVARGGVIATSRPDNQYMTGVSTVDGSLQFARPSASDVTGLATSATTDATNADNITSGTLPVARVPQTFGNNFRDSFATAAALQAATVGGGINTVYLRGYWTEGDGGGATYRRVGSEPTHPAKFQSTDGAWWELAESTPNVLQFGARMDGVTSDRAAWQRALDWADTRNGAIVFPSGSTLIDDELNLCGATTGVSIIGQGHRQSRMFVTAFGAAKAVINGCNANTTSRTSQNNYLANFEIVGSTGLVNQDHPMGIYLPYSTGDHLENIRIRSLGNTAVWTSSANNTRINDVWAVGGGYHYTEDDAASLTPRFSISTSNTTITANAAAFNGGHVGKNFYVDDGSASGFPAAFTIAAVTDSVTATLDRIPTRTTTNNYGSFEGVKATIAGGSLNLVTFNASIARAGDVGRWIYIEGAGANSGVHVAKVATYVSPTQVTLTTPAANAITNRLVYYTPAMFHGTISADVADSRKLNDIMLSQNYVEGWQGVDYLFRDGVNVWSHNSKAHGIGGATRAGRNVHSVVFDAVRTAVWDGGEFDYGYSKDSGNILITGGMGSYTIGNFQASALPENQAFIDFNSSSGNSSLLVNGGHYNKDPAAEPGFIRFSSGAVSLASNVKFNGQIVTRDLTTFQSFNGPQIASSYVTGRASLANDTTQVITTPFTTGVITFWDEGVNESASLYVRTTASPAVTSHFSGTSIATGTGTPGACSGPPAQNKMNIHADNGVIRVKNCMGSSRSIRWMLMGG